MSSWKHLNHASPGAEASRREGRQDDSGIQLLRPMQGAVHSGKRDSDFTNDWLRWFATRRSKKWGARLSIGSKIPWPDFSNDENRANRRENGTVLLCLRLLNWLDIAAEILFAVVQRRLNGEAVG